MSNFESEFKKIVDGLDIDDRPNAEHKDKLRWQMMSKFNDACAGGRADGGSKQGGFYRIRSLIMDRKFAGIAAAAAVIIAAVLIGIYVFNGASDVEKNFVDNDNDGGSGVVENVVKDNESDGGIANDLKIDARDEVVIEVAQHDLEIKRIDKLFAAKDVDGLVGVLKTGSLGGQLAAANYLADMGEDGAIEELKKASDSWKGEGENPFTPIVAKAEKSAKSVDRANDENDETGQLAAVSDGLLDVDNELDTALGLKVIDKVTGKPVVGAEVRVLSQSGRRVATNRFGRYLIELTKKKWVTIEVKEGKYVPRRLHFNPSNYGTVIPKNYVVALEAGTAIGGFVKTESGEPIMNATVKVSIHEDIKNIDNPAISSLPCKTDKDGRWVCDLIPANAREIYLGVEHAVLASVEKYPSRVSSIDTLRDKSHVLLMRGGIDVVGLVIDGDGKPVAGAGIIPGFSRHSSDSGIKTDAEGRFVFAKRSPGGMTLLVKAVGFAQDLKEIQVADELEEIVFVLGEGGTILVRALDVDGNPIKGVTVEADEWRQKSMSQKYQNIRIKENTDAEGLAVLVNVPDEEILYNISKGGFASVQSLALKPSDIEQEVVLYAKGKLVGNVYDADTGEAITEFKKIEGLKRQGRDYISWQDHNPKKVSGGRYELPFNYQTSGYAVKIVADGYLPVESPVFNNEGVNVEHDVYLSKGEGPSGFVFAPDGKAVAGAEVIVATERRPINIESNSVRRDNQNLFDTTEKDGAFKLPAFSGDYKLVVLHDDGVTVVTKAQFEKSNEILLAKWGRLEGVLYNGAEFGVDEKVHLSMNYQMPVPGDRVKVMYQQEVKTNEKGEFVFHKVIPGDLTIAKIVKLKNRSWSYANRTTVEITAGETSVFEFGGGGRKVIGKVLLPEGFTVKNLRDGGFRLKGKAEKATSVELPEIDFPENILVMTTEQRDAWQTELMKSDLYKAFMKQIQESQVSKQVLKSYPIPVEADGSFTIEDVLPGTYEFSGRIHDAALKGKPEYYRDWIYEIKHEIVVEGFEENADFDKPFYAGGIAVSPVKKLKVGDVAPAFELKGLDRAKINLDTFKGKYVLLEKSMGSRTDFNEKILPQLLDLYDEFGGSEFEILNVYTSYGNKSGVMNRPINYFVDYFDIKWTIGLDEIFSWGNNPRIMDDYGMGIAVMYLIAPDGKIAAIESDVDKMREIVSSLMAAEKK